MPGSTDRGNLGLGELPLEELWEKIWKQVNLNFLFDFDLRKSANKLWPVSLIINSGDTTYGSQCWLSSLPSFNSSLLNHQKDFFAGFGLRYADLREKSRIQDLAISCLMGEE